MCGDRNWTDYLAIYEELKTYKSIGYDTIIEGEARGADSIARQVAQFLDMKVLKFPANWNKYGRSAGMIRNQQMLDEGDPDSVVAFHQDIKNSKGTAHMMRIAKAIGLPVTLVERHSSSVI